MKTSLLLGACLASLALTAQAQPVSGGVAGTMGSSGAVNYGAGATPAFGQGAQINGPERQGAVPAYVPPAPKPDAPPAAPKPEEKRDSPQDKATDSGSGQPLPRGQGNN